ncbi:hypothetical protein BH11ARM1_BH11ARM1_02200 [soil metagenome]
MILATVLLFQAMNSTMVLTDPLASMRDERQQSLDALQGHSKMVILFLNEQCSVTFYYKARLQKMVKDFSPKGFVFVGVRVGRKQYPDRPVNLPEMKYLQIPFLDDANGIVMDKFKVGQSLTFAVLDQNRQLRYFGGMDDNVDPLQVKRNPLLNAIRAVAAGKTPAIQRADAIGCAILPMEKSS